MVSFIGAFTITCKDIGVAAGLHVIDVADGIPLRHRRGVRQMRTLMDLHTAGGIMSRRTLQRLIDMPEAEFIHAMERGWSLGELQRERTFGGVERDEFIPEDYGGPTP